jgi:trimeric autotransporter adhesin
MRLHHALTLASVLGGALTAAGQSCTPYWTTLPVPQLIRNPVILDDGNVAHMYAVGYYDRRVRRWDGREWQVLPPVGNQLLAVWLYVLDDGSGPRLYAAVEYFVPATGSTWTSFVLSNQDQWEPGPPGFVTRSEIGPLGDHPVWSYDDGTGMAIYGQVVRPRGLGTIKWVPAKWDGSAWQVMGGEPQNGIVMFYFDFDDGNGRALYAAGNFINLNGASYMARWDGAQWNPVGNGPIDVPYSVKVYNDGSGPAIFYLSCANIAAPHCIQKWDGQQWSFIPGPTSYPGVALSVNRMELFDDGRGPALFFAGTFWDVGGVMANGIARWDGTGWSTLGPGKQLGLVDALLAYPQNPMGPSLVLLGGVEVGGGLAPLGATQWVGCPNCYANCDQSTTPPVLNVEDFSCFINRFAVRDPYANCNLDEHIDVSDFMCFINRFAAGCP